MLDEILALIECVVFRLYGRMRENVRKYFKASKGVLELSPVKTNYCFLLNQLERVCEKLPDLELIDIIIKKDGNIVQFLAVKQRYQRGKSNKIKCFEKKINVKTSYLNLEHEAGVFQIKKKKPANIHCNTFTV